MSKETSAGLLLITEHNRSEHCTSFVVHVLRTYYFYLHVLQVGFVESHWFAIVKSSFPLNFYISVVAGFYNFIFYRFRI